MDYLQSLPNTRAKASIRRVAGAQDPFHSASDKTRLLGNTNPHASNPSAVIPKLPHARAVQGESAERQEEHRATRTPDWQQLVGAALEGALSELHHQTRKELDPAVFKTLQAELCQLVYAIIDRHACGSVTAATTSEGANDGCCPESLQQPPPAALQPPATPKTLMPPSQPGHIMDLEAVKKIPSGSHGWQREGVEGGSLRGQGGQTVVPQLIHNILALTEPSPREVPASQPARAFLFNWPHFRAGANGAVGPISAAVEAGRGARVEHTKAVTKPQPLIPRLNASEGQDSDGEDDALRLFGSLTNGIDRGGSSLLLGTTTSAAADPASGKPMSRGTVGCSADIVLTSRR